ncbi:hypothetical protein WN48_01921 [Eufriesea mexicana]|uniref:Uncharacterized protein n=1 Tax=Eufriesea mexicana TaxID=516756 RepID=A0A310SC38_9HYME|nr:hypothetical protein WN48_01921 [Eufriesea mexicana]
MDLYSDIKKLTQIPQADENVVFIRRKESYALKQNQKLKNLKSPPNENLYDLDDSQSYDKSLKCSLHENEIASSIHEVNIMHYANENIEKHWKNRQMKTNSNSKDNIFPETLVPNNCHENSSTEVCNTISMLRTNENKRTEDAEDILKKCGLNRNALIKGLLNNHIISVKDLDIPNDYTDVKSKKCINVQKENVPSENTLYQEDCMKLVQCPEDPEVFVQSLQVHGHIDESKYKNIDFTVPHIGKKNIVTPRQYFINTDSNFDFIKKNVEN